MLKRVHIIILGDVRGVGFRFSTIQTARELGLVGWVRNIEEEGLPADNRTTSRASNEGKASGKIWRVEIIAEGPRDKLENLATWARSGPSLARVTKINIKWEKATGEFTEFELRK